MATQHYPHNNRSPKPRSINKKNVSGVPEPEIIKKNYTGSSKLAGKVAIITGGDSGIGRSVALHYAREGADVAIVFHNDSADAKETQKMVENEGKKCLLLKGDLSKPAFCKQVIKKTLAAFKQIDILVNNAGIQVPQDTLEDITDAQVKKTFETNIFSMFTLTREALQHLKKGARIINTTSVTAYRGSDHLLDYSSTKGAITSFTRSLAVNLAKKNILVNGIAPGPVWTPLVTSTLPPKEQKDFGKKTALGRAGHPSEIAPAYVFLASDEASFITGEIIHINGGDFVGG